MGYPRASCLRFRSGVLHEVRPFHEVRTPTLSSSGSFGVLFCGELCLPSRSRRTTSTTSIDLRDLALIASLPAATTSFDRTPTLSSSGPFGVLSVSAWQCRDGLSSLGHDTTAMRSVLAGPPQIGLSVQRDLF